MTAGLAFPGSDAGRFAAAQTLRRRPNGMETGKHPRSIKKTTFAVLAAVPSKGSAHSEQRAVRAAVMDAALRPARKRSFGRERNRTVCYGAVSFGFVGIPPTAGDPFRQRMTASHPFAEQCAMAGTQEPPTTTSFVWKALLFVFITVRRPPLAPTGCVSPTDPRVDRIEVEAQGRQVSAEKVAPLCPAECQLPNARTSQVQQPWSSSGDEGGVKFDNPGRGAPRGTSNHHPAR